MSRGFRDALQGRGIPPIARGDVRIVPNEGLTLTWPTTRSHEHRVVVVGNPALLQSNGIPVVTIVPCTSSPRLNDDVLEVAIPPYEVAFTRQAYAITYLTQPVHREALGELVGTVSDETLMLIDAGIIEALGVLAYHSDDEAEGD